MHCINSIINIPKEITTMFVTDSDLFYLKLHELSLERIIYEAIRLIMVRSISAVTPIRSEELFLMEEIIPLISFTDVFRKKILNLRAKVNNGTIDIAAGMEELHTFYHKSESITFMFYKLMYQFILFEAKTVLSNFKNHSIKEPFIKNVEIKNLNDSFMVAFEWILTPIK